MAVDYLRELVIENKDILRTVILFGSRSDATAREDSDLDYIVILRDSQDLQHVEAIAEAIKRKTGVVSDANCLYESEALREAGEDFMVHDIIHNGEVIYDDGFVRQLKKIGISPNAGRGVIRKRLERIQRSKETALESLHRILYIGFYRYLYDRTGEVVPMHKIDSVMLSMDAYPEYVSLGRQIIKLKKARANLSFLELSELESKVYKALEEMGGGYEKEFEFQKLSQYKQR